MWIETDLLEERWKNNSKYILTGLNGGKENNVLDSLTRFFLHISYIEAMLHFSHKRSMWSVKYETFSGVQIKASKQILCSYLSWW